MVNAVILEDDPLLGKNLSLMLQEFCPEIKIIALIESGKTALDILPLIQYDLVFSDIDLGDMDAFKLFEKLDYSQKHIIFITAHTEFAINAFKLDATDYLLKPILPEELQRAVNRALAQIKGRQETLPVTGALGIQKNGKILIKSNDEMHFIAPEKIVYCEADGAYTKIFIDDNLLGYKVITMHLKKIEEALPKDYFYRIHDAIIINTNFIDHIIFPKRICVLKNVFLNDKIQLKISERKYQGFIDFLRNN